MRMTSSSPATCSRTAAVRSSSLDWVQIVRRRADAIARDEHDVVLVDYRLGEHDGIELLRQARSMASARR